jgi:hypothetical protein
MLSNIKLSVKDLSLKKYTLLVSQINHFKKNIK